VFLSHLKQFYNNALQARSVISVVFVSSVTTDLCYVGDKLTAIIYVKFQRTHVENINTV